jgi:NAD(P)-dependent dehydrogenase (short-subunit alcohol dehydrogenase family)
MEGLVPDFSGKVVLITGASRGLGRVLALGIARRGGSLAGTARQLESSPGVGGTLAETRELAQQAGARFLAIAGDITTYAGAQAAVDATLAEYGRLDVLVNNAGIFPKATIAETSPADWRALMDINVNAVFYATRAALPHLVAGGGGAILNVSSGAATGFAEGRAGYAVTKWGMNRLTVNLAAEVREANVAVNAINPGIIETDMNLGRPGADPPSVFEESAVWLAAQRVPYTGRIVSRADFGRTWGAGVE